MKKFIASLSILISLLISISPVYAVTPSVTVTSAATPAASVIDKLKQIEIFKDKIATKVAQLRESEKGGAFGSIKSVGDTTITLTARDKDQTVSYSEDTIFFKIANGTKSDPMDWKESKKLKTGDRIAVLGYFDSGHTSFSAKYIYLINPQVHLIGKISDLDKENYTISVKEPKGNTLTDIENYTKIYTYNIKSGIIRSGFSKLKDNDIVHVFATPNVKEENRVSATKIISLTLGESLPTSTPSAR